MRGRVVGTPGRGAVGAVMKAALLDGMKTAPVEGINAGENAGIRDSTLPLIDVLVNSLLKIKHSFKL